MKELRHHDIASLATASVRSIDVHRFPAAPALAAAGRAADCAARAAAIALLLVAGLPFAARAQH